MRTEGLADKVLDSKNAKQILKHCSLKSQLKFLTVPVYDSGFVFIAKTKPQYKPEFLKFLKYCSDDAQKAVVSTDPNLLQHCNKNMQLKLATKNRDKF